MKTGRLFVCGDIHGCFDALDNRLDELGFDYDNDTLVAVGDLVDRGPDSLAFMDYIDQKWFHSVKGNHEAMCCPQFAGSHWHVANGGTWYNDVVSNFGETYAETVGRKLTELPVMIEMEHNGKRYGFVHASLFGQDDWKKAWANQDKWDSNGEHPYLWDRQDIRDAMTMEKRGLEPDRFYVDNIDHVYFGHTPIKQPFHFGNCSWIDTGCFATDDLTVLEIT